MIREHTVHPLPPLPQKPKSNTYYIVIYKGRLCLYVVCHTPYHSHAYFLSVSHKKTRETGKYKCLI